MPKGSLSLYRNLSIGGRLLMWQLLSSSVKLSAGNCLYGKFVVDNSIVVDFRSPAFRSLKILSTMALLCRNAVKPRMM